MHRKGLLSPNRAFSLLFLLVLTSFPMMASDNALSAGKVEKLLAETSSRYETIETLSSSFTQVRTTRLLKKPAVTKGKFYYEKPAHFLWQFTDPYNISVLSKSKFLFKIDTRRGTYSKLKVKKYKSTMMNFMDVSKTFKFLNKYFYIKEIDTKLKDTYIIFIPKKRRVKKRVKLVEIWLYPDTRLFHRIKVEEKNGSVTDITFHNSKINCKLPAGVFDISLKGLKKEKWQE
ncbi:MAG: outer membrane lipoprotein carrier protein LolA [Acidobacteria bacterium]|nr:outer membrane lipoprotein carrier protein LolA [Acidobacteriota bacterium]